MTSSRASEASAGDRSVRSRERARVGIFGPLLGDNPGRVTSQGQILADRLAGEGFQVHAASTRLNRAVRGIDLLRSSMLWRRRLDVAVVMVFSGLAYWQSVVALGPLARQTRIVLALHGGDLPSYSRRHPDRVRRLLDRADALVAPSSYLAGFFRTWGYKVHVIPNVVDLNDCEYRHRERVTPTLFWMRAFSDIYSPETAVRVLAILRRTFPEARLTMAGQAGDRLQPTIDLARRLDVAGSVRFAGFLSTAQKQQEFADHDIYLHTNLVDNMPVSVVEACAFGLPVVASRVGGIPHLLENEVSGLLAQPGDAEGLASQVVRLVNDPALAARLSDNGRAVAESSTWDSVRTAWRDVLEGVR